MPHIQYSKLLNTRLLGLKLKIWYNKTVWIQWFLSNLFFVFVTKMWTKWINIVFVAYYGVFTVWILVSLFVWFDPYENNIHAFIIVEIGPRWCQRQPCDREIYTGRSTLTEITHGVIVSCLIGYFHSTSSRISLNLVAITFIIRVIIWVVFNFYSSHCN